MSQQSPQPLNVRGAVDLAALAARSAPAPERGTSWARDVTAETFSDVVQESTSYPVVVALWASWSAASKELLSDLAALADQDAGRWLLARVDAEANPQIAQVFQAGSVPVVVAVLAGRPLPLFEGRPPVEQIRAVIDQVLEAAQANGIAGTVPAAAEEPEPEAPPLPPLHQEAQEAIAANDIARARSAYERALAQNPGDDEARVGVVRVALLERGAQLTDLAAVRQAAGDRPDDVDAQLAVADLDVIGGHVTDAFARLVDVARRTSGPERERVRQRLVELFEVVGTADPRVVAARRSLASALY